MERGSKSEQSCPRADLGFTRSCRASQPCQHLQPFQDSWDLYILLDVACIEHRVRMFAFRRLQTFARSATSTTWRWSLQLQKRFSLIASALLIASCNRDGDVIGSATLPNIRGRFVVEDDARTMPLTSVQHSVYYVVGDDRKLIFQGFDGKTPVISLLNEDVIIVRYCGGRIEEIESSFREDGAGKEGEDFRILRLQPVTSPGLVVNGQALCGSPVPASL